MHANGNERGYLAALAAVIIWALVPVGTRFFVLRVDPTMFNVIRYAASGASVLPLFFYARPWRWPRRDQILLAGCAFLAVPGYNIPVALGAQSVPAGELGLLIATEPALIVAFTLLLQRRRMRWRIIAGCAVALAGVALTSGVLTAPRTVHWASDLEVLAGAASWSCYTVLIARLNQRHGAVGVTGAVLVLGTVFLMVISAPMIHSKPWPGSSMLLALAGMGVASSTVGFLLWNYAGALLPAERLGLFLYLIPVVCIAAGAQFLNESLTLPILVGGTLTVFGVWIASRTAAPDAAILQSARRLARMPLVADILRGKTPAPRAPTRRPEDDAQGLTPGARRP
ncbi:MAG: DMT family transporter [Steroidobacteraceae bacterium]